MKVGIPTSTVIRPRTRKEKQDWLQRRADNKGKKKKMLADAEKRLGPHYQCSSCANTVRLNDVGDRKILCSKCNAGIFQLKQKKQKKK